MQAQQQDELAEEKGTIYSLCVMMSQLLVNLTKKKGSKHSKKKHKLTSSESLEEEDKRDAIHIELPSNYNEPSNNDKGGSQHINEFEQCLVVIVNHGKRQEAGRDRPYPMEWDLVCYPRKFKPPMLHQCTDKGSPS